MLIIQQSVFYEGKLSSQCSSTNCIYNLSIYVRPISI